MNAIILAVLFASAGAAPGQTFELQNRFITRKVAVVDGRLTTVELRNKRCEKLLVPTSCEEFGYDSRKASTARSPTSG